MFHIIIFITCRSTYTDSIRDIFINVARQGHRTRFCRQVKLVLPRRVAPQAYVVILLRPVHVEVEITAYLHHPTTGILFLGSSSPAVTIPCPCSVEASIRLSASVSSATSCFRVMPVVGSTTAFHIVAGYTVFPFSFSFLILAIIIVIYRFKKCHSEEHVRNPRPKCMSFRASGATRNFLASESKGKNLFHFAECRRKSAPPNS